MSGFETESGRGLESSHGFESLHGCGSSHGCGSWGEPSRGLGRGLLLGYGPGLDGWCGVPFDRTKGPETVPSPEAAEADALLDLGDRIAKLAASIHAATHRMLVMLREFDRRGGWKASGSRNCADWLAFRTGMTKGAARERVRAARALEALPETSAAMSRGELSFAKVRALTRAATPENETELVEYAKATTAAAVERLVRSWKRRDRKDEAEYERELHRSRTFSVVPDEEGMCLVRGRLDAEVGALLMQAIEAADDVLYREERAERREGERSSRDPEVKGDAETGSGVAAPTGTKAREPGASAETWAVLQARVLREYGGPGHEEATPAQRRADAVGLLAERVLGVGFGERSETEAVEEEDAGSELVSGEAGSAGEQTGASEEQTGASGGRPGSRGEETGGSSETSGAPTRDSCACGEETGASGRAPISGTRSERYQVVLHVDADTLSADREPGRSHLADGTRVAAETSRRLCCDAAVVWMKRAKNGAVLDAGRRTRTVSPALRRALEVRDVGCRFPGCGGAYTDAHHIVHWADGGETCLKNLVLLCWRHHRLVHEGGFTVVMEMGDRMGRGHADRPVFYDPRGIPVPSLPPRIRLSDIPIEGLEWENERVAGGKSPDWSTAGARYRSHEDVPPELEGPAIEAILAGADGQTPPNSA